MDEKNYLKNSKILFISLIVISVVYIAYAVIGNSFNCYDYLFKVKCLCGCGFESEFAFLIFKILRILYFAVPIINIIYDLFVIITKKLENTKTIKVFTWISIILFIIRIIEFYVFLYNTNLTSFIE